MVWNQEFCVFRHIRCLNRAKSSDFKQYLKSELFGNWTVIECLKSILVWISDAYCEVYINYRTKGMVGVKGLHFTCVFKKDFVHVWRCILEEFVVRVEDDDQDLAIAQNAQLIGLLHQSKFALCKRNLGKYYLSF